MQKKIIDILEDLDSWLKFQKNCGVDRIKKDLIESMEKIKKDSQQVSPEIKQGNKGSVSQPVEKTPFKVLKTLSELQSVVEKCNICRLSSTRNRVVFGEGSSNPILMLIGEAPGREEDIQGRPFVGKSGELLTKMLRAINIKRKEVFITSVVKCRPPRNRTPGREEIEACLPYLLKQIELLSPKIILCLGSVAAHNLLNGQIRRSAPTKYKSISELRGNFFDLHGIKVAVTYHPAYLLRFGGEKLKNIKRKVWSDLQMLQREYDKFK